MAIGAKRIRAASYRHVGLGWASQHASCSHAIMAGRAIVHIASLSMVEAQGRYEGFGIVANIATVRRRQMLTLWPLQFADDRAS